MKYLVRVFDNNSVGEYHGYFINFYTHQGGTYFAFDKDIKKAKIWKTEAGANKFINEWQGYLSFRLELEVEDI